MTKWLVALVVLGVLAVGFVGVAACASPSGVGGVEQGVKCPIEGGGAASTGNTMVDVSGKVLWEYRCFTYGHLFWVVR